MPLAGRISYQDESPESVDQQDLADERVEVEVPSAEQRAKIVASTSERHEPGEIVIQNPDKVLDSQGGGFKQRYGVYEKMLRTDPVLAGFLIKRKNFVLSGDFEVKATGVDDVDEVAQEIVDLLTRNDGQGHNPARQLLEGIAFGFSASEIVWSERSGGLFLPDRVVNRPQWFFRFSNRGNLYYRRHDRDFDYEPAPPFKFVVFRAVERWNNPYGEALLRDLYWPWYRRIHAAAGWSDALSAQAKPPLDITYEGRDDYEKAKKLEDSYAEEQVASLTHPDSIELDTLDSGQSKSSQAGSFRDHIEHIVTWEYLLRIFGSTLGSVEGKRGSLALGEVHAEQQESFIDTDRSRLEATINEQILRPAIEINFGADLDEFPEVKITSNPRREVEEVEKLIQIAAQLKIELSKSQLLDWLDVGEPDPTNPDDAILPTMRQGGIGALGFPQPPGEDEDGEDEPAPARSNGAPPEDEDE